MKKGRKGASHVEFVLSFVIFVVFLIFMYNGLEPIVQSAGSKQFVLGHLKLAMVENLTLSDFTIQTFTIKISVEDIQDEIQNSNKNKCISIQKGGLFKIIEGGNKNLTIKNENGKILNYSVQPDSPQVPPNWLMIGSTDDLTNIVKVYFASDFTNRSPELNPDPAPGRCYGLDETQYELRTVTEKEIIASTNIFDIQEWYELNYDALNYALGIPSGSDWTFEFQTIEFLNGDMEALIEPNPHLIPPENTDVYVGEFPIQYIDEEATTKIGFIRVTVW